jgi:sugar phosphate isomerase/epimerase
MQSKIGFSSYIFGRRNWVHSTRYAIENGYDFVELMNEFPQDDLSESIMTRLLAMKNNYDIGIVVHAPVIEVDLGNIRDNIRKSAINTIKGSIKIAETLGSDILVTHCGYKPFSSKKSGITSEQQMIQKHAWKRCSDKLYDSLSEIASFGNDCGIKIGVENTDSPHSYVYSTDDFLLYGEIPNVFYVFDVGHANCKGTPYDYPNKINGKLVEVHVSDNDGEMDTHSPLGTGIIDFKRVIKELDKNNFSGNVVLDLQAGYGDELEKSRKYLENCHE